MRNYDPATDVGPHRARRRRPRRGSSTTYRDALRAHQEELNRLNVYPVPDGDTGTNMALTLESVCDELGSANPDGRRLQGDRARLAHGRPRQLGRDPLADPARPRRHVPDPRRDRARPTWRSRPPGGGRRRVPGRDAPGRGDDPHRRRARRPSRPRPRTPTARAISTACSSGRSRPRTRRSPGRPSCSRCSKDAGVVDAGGRGFALLLDAFLRVVDGRPLPEPRDRHDAGRSVPRRTAPSARTSSSLRYEVMYLLDAPDADHHRVQELLGRDSATRSSSSAATGCGTATCTPTTSAPRSRRASRPGDRREIRVTDLHEQVEEEQWVACRGRDPDASAPSGERVATGVIAIGVGDGVRRLLARLGVQEIVAGGQSMNPSTAQILEAIERAAAEVGRRAAEQQEHRPGGRAGRRARRAAPVGVVPTQVGRGGARGDSIDFDPDADLAATTSAPMGEAAGRVRAGEVTQAVRDSDGRVRRRSRTATGSRSPRDGICAATASALEAAAVAVLDELIDEDSELVTVLVGAEARRGRRRQAARAPRRSSTRTSRSRCTRAASRCTRSSSVWNRGARWPSAPASRCASCDERPVTELKAVGDASSPSASESWGSRRVLDLLTHYPRRYHDRRHTQEIADLVGRRGGDRLRRGEEGDGAATRASAARIVEIEMFDGTSYLKPHVLQPAVAREAARRGHRGRVLRPGRALPGATPDDEPGRRHDRRAGEPGDETGVLVPVYPASGKADVHTWQLRRLRHERARPDARRAGSPTRSMTRCAATHLGSLDRTTAYRGIHQPPTRWTRRSRAPAAHVRRVPPHAGRARRAQACARARAGRHRARRATARSSSAFAASLPFALTGDQQQVIADIVARPGVGRRRCTACSRARWARARRSSRSTRCSWRCRAGTRARSWRRPRCSPSSTSSRCAQLLDGLTVPEEGSLLGERPVARRAAHEPHERRGAPPHRRGPARRDGRHPRRDARARSTRACSSRDLGLVVVDEQHRFGVEQRDLLRGKGDPTAASPTCSS